jgi:CHAT domain-containing protein
VEKAIEDLSGTDASLRLARLSGTRWEAEQIMVHVPPKAGMKALDFAASRATATSPALSNYRILHFATHALINNRHPELSGIVLSLVDEQGWPQDGFLRAHEIYHLKLPAELVVLSGCQRGPSPPTLLS